MHKALRKHEEGHRKIFLDQVSALESKLKALKGAKGDEIDQMREDALAGIKKAHDTYDTRTQHGATEGVRLTIEDECDSTK